MRDNLLPAMQSADYNSLSTDEDGLVIQFWANSSYGDSSEMFSALVRVALTNEGDPDRVVLVCRCVEQSMGWRASCKLRGGLGNIAPRWRTARMVEHSHRKVKALGTDIPYNYLAAQLIRQGAVDASSCPDGGLLPEDGGASDLRNGGCARTQSHAWQNQFDSIILNVAKDSGVPAHLLKNLFRDRKSVLAWASLKSDIGLGQLTEIGADTTLLWNSSILSSVLSVGDGFKGMQ